MLKKLNVRMGCIFTSPISLSFTKKFDVAEKSTTNDSVDGNSVLPETAFVWISQYVDTTRDLSVGVLCSQWEQPEAERPELDIRTPLGSVLQLFFPRGYLLKSIPQGTLPQDNGCLKSVLLSNVMFQRISNIAYQFARYTAGNSLPSSGLLLRPGFLTLSELPTIRWTSKEENSNMTLANAPQIFR